MPYLRQASRNSSSEASATIISRSVVVHDEQLVDAHPALVAGVVALVAALAVEELLGRRLARRSCPAPWRPPGWAVNSVRQLAQILPHQPLGQHRLDGRRDEERSAAPCRGAG